MKIFNNILETIGGTPLVRFPKITAGLGADCVFKLEFFNPLGSVKDRIAKSMIERAEKSGRLKSGMKVVEASSGNTGIGLAFVCAAKGYPLTVTMPETMSMERRTLLMLLGAEVVLTPAALGMKGAMAKALEIASKESSVFIPSQFENLDNPLVHRETTALEIWNDTDGKVDYVVSGVGTGGTITGVGQVLKAKKPSVKMIAVEPFESPVLSGGAHSPHKIQGIGAGFVPAILDRNVVDEIEKVSSVDALAMAKKVIKLEGVPVGISSGAAIAACLRIASRPEAKGKLVVAIIPSYTERYLSTLLAETERTAAGLLEVFTPAPEFLETVNKSV